MVRKRDEGTLGVRDNDVGNRVDSGTKTTDKNSGCENGREKDDTSRKLFENKTLISYFVSGGRSLNRCVIKFSYVFWVRPG